MAVNSSDLNSFDRWLEENSKNVFYKLNTPITIHPIFALKILQTFGFRVVNGDDNLLYVEDVNHWLQTKMDQTFQSPIIRQFIRDLNSGVRLWLHELVYLINSNPAVLNRDINNIRDALFIIDEYKKSAP